MVAPELCQKASAAFGAPIQIVYGQTEASPVITQAWYEDCLEDLTGTIGQPRRTCRRFDPRSGHQLGRGNR